MRIRPTRPATILSAAIAFLAAGAPLRSDARIPEPDTIIVGSVADAAGNPLLSAPDRRIRVCAVVDGATLATATVPAGSSSFVLRVPMDDGVAPRIPGTAKSSDVIRVVVENPSAGVSVESEETKSGGIEIPAGRGNILQMSFRFAGTPLPTDLDGDGMPDDWEARFASGREGVAPLDPSAADAALDNDGDGLTNFEEWIAGTDPLDSASRFAFESIAPDGAAVGLAFSPVFAGRVYKVYRSTALGDSWELVATFEPDEDARRIEWTWTGGDADTGFFRAEVEFAP